MSDVTTNFAGQLGVRLEAKNPFEYQKPTEESVVKITEFREKAKELFDLTNTLKPSRERSLAITKLEEFSMWVNKHIVFVEQD